AVDVDHCQPSDLRRRRLNTVCKGPVTTAELHRDGAACRYEVEVTVAVEIAARDETTGSTYGRGRGESAARTSKQHVDPLAASGGDQIRQAVAVQVAGDHVENVETGCDHDRRCERSTRVHEQRDSLRALAGLAAGDDVEIAVAVEV